MEALLLPPTPADGLALAPVAIPAPVAAPARAGEARSRSALRAAADVAADVLLLPLRLLRRLAVDLATAATHAVFAVWTAVLATVLLALTAGGLAVEAFGESIFVKDIFEMLSVNAREYLDRASALGALLAMSWPELDEVRASTVVATIFALAGVAASAVFFRGLEQWTQYRKAASPAVQETLLLDPQVQQPAPPPPAQPRDAWPAVRMTVGAGATGGIFALETAGFALLLERLWLALVIVTGLLAVRLVAGFLTHRVFGLFLAQTGATLDHVRGLVVTVTRVVPNLVEEALQLLVTLGQR